MTDFTKNKTGLDDFWQLSTETQSFKFVTMPPVTQQQSRVKQNFNNFWEIDSGNNKPYLNKENKFCEDHFEITYKKISQVDFY